MAAAAAAAVVRGTTVWKRPVFSTHYGLMLWTRASRRHPLSLGWVFRHEQPRSDGGSLRNGQPGVGGQQLPECCQPRPQHRLQPQFRGEARSPLVLGSIS